MSSAAHRRLCAALLRHVPSAHVIEARERPWASVTFAGARHWLTLLVPAAYGANIAQDLPEADLPLVGHIVADLAVIRQTPKAGGIALVLEALTVEASTSSSG